MLAPSFQTFLYDNVLGHVLTVATRGQNVKHPADLPDLRLSRARPIRTSPGSSTRTSTTKTAELWLIEALGIREHGAGSRASRSRHRPVHEPRHLTKLIPPARRRPTGSSPTSCGTGASCTATSFVGPTGGPSAADQDLGRRRAPVSSASTRCRTTAIASVRAGPRPALFLSLAGQRDLRPRAPSW